MQPIDRLRTILRADAAFTGALGVAALAFAQPLTDLLGPDRPGIVRVVGAALVLLAVDVALLSRASERRLVAGARIVAAFGVAWTVVMVALALTGVLDGGGIVLALATAVATAEFAWFEWAGAAQVSALGLRREVYA